MPSAFVNPVAVIGAGLAGLNCARVLNAAGVACEMFEATGRVGGRCGGETVNGYTFDHGFQVLLDSYPELPAAVDLSTLDLKPFTSGAMIWLGDRFTTVVNPLERPAAAFSALLSPVGTLGDKLRVLRLLARSRRAARGGFPENIETIQRLKLAGLSDRIIMRFFRPFFAGVFLENELSTSSRQFDFLLPLFATGKVTLPARGMQALPEAMAAALTKTRIHLNRPVAAIENGRVGLPDGTSVAASAVIAAAEPDVAGRLLGIDVPRGQRWTSTTAVYFDAAAPPTTEPLLMLNGSDHGRLNNAAVLTNVAPTYAPAGRALVVCNFVGSLDDADAQTAARSEMRLAFGDKVDRWRHLRTISIEKSLPDKSVAAYATIERPPRVREGVYVAGDHCDFASINGALAAGRRAGEAVLAAFHMS